VIAVLGVLAAALEGADPLTLVRAAYDAAGDPPPWWPLILGALPPLLDWRPPLEPGSPSGEEPLPPPAEDADEDDEDDEDDCEE
jgi:hypothetical protein